MKRGSAGKYGFFAVLGIVALGLAYLVVSYLMDMISPTEKKTKSSPTEATNVQGGTVQGTPTTSDEGSAVSGAIDEALQYAQDKLAAAEDYLLSFTSVGM